MKMLLQKIVDAIYAYGKAGAGMESTRGMYIATVPNELRGQEDNESL